MEWRILAFQTNSRSWQRRVEATLGESHTLLLCYYWQNLKQFLFIDSSKGTSRMLARSRFKCWCHYLPLNKGTSCLTLQASVSLYVTYKEITQSASQFIGGSREQSWEHLELCRAQVYATVSGSPDEGTDRLICFHGHDSRGDLWCRMWLSLELRNKANSWKDSFLLASSPTSQKWHLSSVRIHTSYMETLNATQINL